MSAGSPGITVLIATKDEEVHIGRCVDSARPLGRVVVVDAASADRTAAVARAHGAEVVEHGWAGYAAQKNWASTTSASRRRGCSCSTRTSI